MNTSLLYTIEAAKELDKKWDLQFAKIFFVFQT